MIITIGKPCAITEKGGRSNNEDSIYPLPEQVTLDQKLFMVCDGVGGAEKGEVASSLACESIQTFFSTFLKDDPTPEFIHKAVHYAEVCFDSYVHLLARRMGKKRIIAETGAGQHGVATATVCALMDMECIVYMGKTDVERQHINVEKMKMLGATVIPVTSGNMTLKDATNEAIRDWCCHPADTYYIIGSTVGPHPYPDMVARLQSVISEEIKKQLQEKEGRDYPDYLIACVGGGSNAAGTIYHYINDERVGIILAEAGGKGIETGMTAATIQLGKMGIIHGARTYVIQNEDGQIEEPYSISAGLDYPGIGPIHANLAAQRRANVLAINDDEAIEAAYELTKLEGIIPALESAHALGALRKLKFKPEDIVVLTVSGRGDKDIETYLSFNEQQ